MKTYNASEWLAACASRKSCAAIISARRESLFLSLFVCVCTCVPTALEIVFSFPRIICFLHSPRRQVGHYIS